MLKELLRGNPIMLDYRRVIRRLFGVGKAGKINLAVSTIIALIYGLMLLLAITNHESVDPRSYVLMLGVIFALVIPAASHAAIAGERERRSWDFLLVAPISNAQIIAGKFMSGVGIVLLLTTLIVPLILIASASYTGSVLVTIGMLIMMVCFGIFLNAVSIYISSRSRRAFSANLTIYALQFVTMIVLPIIITILSNSQADTWAFFLHPFVVGMALSQEASSSYGGHGLLTAGGGMIQAVTYLILTLALLGWTEATLRDLDRTDGGG